MYGRAMRAVVAVLCLSLMSVNVSALTKGIVSSYTALYDESENKVLDVSAGEQIIVDESRGVEGNNRRKTYYRGVEAYIDANHVLNEIIEGADYGVCQVIAGTSLTSNAGSGDVTVKTTGPVYAVVEDVAGDYFKVSMGAFDGYVHKDRVRFCKDYEDGLVDSFSAATLRLKVVEEAEKYLGVQYVWGGTSPSGFDCSGLMQYVYNKFGIDIPRVAEDQCGYTTHVSATELLPGDMVFFKNSSGIHHVGMYVGDGNFIHAPYTGTVVKFGTLREGHYREEFYCGGRVIF